MRSAEPFDPEATLKTPSKGLPTTQMTPPHITPPSGALARVPCLEDQTPPTGATLTMGRGGLEVVNFRDPSQRETGRTAVPSRVSRARRPARPSGSPRRLSSWRLVAGGAWYATQQTAPYRQAAACPASGRFSGPRCSDAARLSPSRSSESTRPRRSRRRPPLPCPRLWPKSNRLPRRRRSPRGSIRCSSAPFRWRPFPWTARRSAPPCPPAPCSSPRDRTRRVSKPPGLDAGVEKFTVGAEGCRPHQLHVPRRHALDQRSGVDGRQRAHRQQIQGRSRGRGAIPVESRHVPRHPVARRHRPRDGTGHDSAREAPRHGILRLRQRAHPEGAREEARPSFAPPSPVRGPSPRRPGIGEARNGSQAPLRRRAIQRRR